MPNAGVYPESDTPAIALEDVTKTLGNTQALDGVSVEIDGPGVVGIIGPNGAGKTTLLRILSCQIRPDTGSARVLGRSIVDDSYEVRRRLTLLPQRVKGHFYTFTPEEYIYHYHRIRGRSRRGARAATKRAIDEFGIEFADKTIDELSGGMVGRTVLAMTLSFESPIYLLDEPTAALDPAAKQALWERIREMAEESLVLMTSHHTDEIADVCDRVLLLDAGQVAVQGTTESVADRYLPGYDRKLVVETSAAVPPGVEPVETVDRGRYRHVYPADETAFERVRDRLTAAECPHEVTDVTVEDLFLTGWTDGIR